MIETQNSSIGNLEFTLWDVGHRLAVWVRTPSGHDQWFDLGNTPEFSPVEQARKYHSVKNIDLLGSSHYDGDHLADLPNFRKWIGDPRVLLHNASFVTMLLCDGVLIACPGDIEPLGWRHTHPHFRKNLSEHVR